MSVRYSPPPRRITASRTTTGKDGPIPVTATPPAPEPPPEPPQEAPQDGQPQDVQPQQPEAAAPEAPAAKAGRGGRKGGRKTQ